MDRRVYLVTSPSGIFVFGRRFGNMADAEQYAEATIARREKLAGRTLTAKELRDGVAHPSDLDARARIAARNWRPTMPVDDTPVDDNPFRQPRPQTAPTHPSKARKEIYANAERDWDARKEREAKAAEPITPRRAAALEAADLFYERIAFDPTQPESALIRATQLMEQARVGCLDAFKAQFVEAQAPLKQQADTRAADLEAQIQALKAQLPDEFEPTPSVPKTDYFYQDEAARRARGEA